MILKDIHGHILVTGNFTSFRLNPGSAEVPSHIYLVGSGHTATITLFTPAKPFADAAIAKKWEDDRKNYPLSGIFNEIVEALKKDSRDLKAYHHIIIAYQAVNIS